jgi:ferredoxin
MKGDKGNIAEKILSVATRLFDAAGIAPSRVGNILILGIATSPQQNLDEFFRDEQHAFHTPGFERIMLPRLNKVVDSLREMGVSAAIFGHCGYPEGSQLNLKRLAVASGIASWGKNAMVLHPRFGPRLRLASIRLDIPEPTCTGPGLAAVTTNQTCQDCEACINVCPEGVLDAYYIRDHRACRANTSGMPPGPVECCSLCWQVCPAGGSGQGS